MSIVFCLLFNIIRNAILKNLVVTLGLRPNQENVEKLFSESKNLGYDLLGLKVESSPNKNGVIIIDIDSSSNAYEKNIRIGDIITEIGNEKVTNRDIYTKILEKYKSGEAIMLRIINNSNARYEAFEIN